jgi:transketolase
VRARLLTTCSDFAAIEGAISEAKSNPSAPTIINLKTTIGFGSLKAGGHDVHGARESISCIGALDRVAKTDQP